MNSIRKFVLTGVVCLLAVAGMAQTVSYTFTGTIDSSTIAGVSAGSSIEWKFSGINPAAPLFSNSGESLFFADTTTSTMSVGSTTYTRSFQPLAFTEAGNSNLGQYSPFSGGPVYGIWSNAAASSPLFNEIPITYYEVLALSESAQVINASGFLAPGQSAASFYRFGGYMRDESNQFAFFTLNSYSTDAAPAAVPEPSTYAAIFGAAALVSGVWVKRRRVTVASAA